MIGHREFEIIAGILRAARERGERDPNAVLDHLALDFDCALAELNPRFDSKRFLAACGVAE